VRRSEKNLTRLSIEDQRRASTDGEGKGGACPAFGSSRQFFANFTVRRILTAKMQRIRKVREGISEKGKLRLDLPAGNASGLKASHDPFAFETKQQLLSPHGRNDNDTKTSESICCDCRASGLRGEESFPQAIRLMLSLTSLLPSPDNEKFFSHS
jgi:hypothetical protein